MILEMLRFWYPVECPTDGNKLDCGILALRTAEEQVLGQIWSKFKSHVLETHPKGAKTNWQNRSTIAKVLVWGKCKQDTREMTKARIRIDSWWFLKCCAFDTLDSCFENSGRAGTGSDLIKIQKCFGDTPQRSKNQLAKQINKQILWCTGR